jgi:hypothetical protein
LEFQGAVKIAKINLGIGIQQQRFYFAKEELKITNFHFVSPYFNIPSSRKSIISA